MKKSYLKAFISVSMCLIFLLINSFVIVKADNFNINEEKIDLYLQEQLETLNDDDKIAVSVWMTDIDHDMEQMLFRERLLYKIESSELPVEAIDLLSISLNDLYDVNKIHKIDNAFSTEEMQDFILTKRSISKDIYIEENQKKINSIFNQICLLDDIIFVSHYAPMFIINLNKHEIVSLCDNDEIVKVYYHYSGDWVSDESSENENNENENIRSNPYSNNLYSVSGIDDLRDNYGLTGNGIKVGIFDVNFTDESLIDFLRVDAVQDYYGPNDNILNSYYTHGSNVACIISGDYYDENTGNYYLGAVPDAKIYLATPSSGSQNAVVQACLEHLLDCGVNVINCSITSESLPLNTYTDLSMWIDHVVSQHSVMYVSATGNLGATGVRSNYFTYNGIAVGACYATGNYYNFSSYCNDSSKPFKPDLVAPGCNVITPLSFGDLTHYNGTSWAAPMVTGAVAQLCQASTVLATNPCLLKSLLLAGSELNMYLTWEYNMFSNTISADNKFCPKYGSGTLNVKNAYVSYLNNSFVFGGMPSFINSSQVSKYLNATEGDIIRVCAVWDKKTTVDNPHASNNATSNGIEYYLLAVSTPSSINYRAVTNSDTKDLITFEAEESGTYVISLVRMNNYVNSYTNIGISCSVQNN